MAPARRCAIRHAQLRGRAQFHVVEIEDDGTTHVVAGSAEFRAAGGQPLSEDGDAREAFAELAARLQAAGWTRVESSGAWHDAEFVRAAEAGYERAIVTFAHGRRRARFLAFLLDDVGTPSGYAESPFFGVPGGDAVKRSGAPQKAHEDFLRNLFSDGWHVTGTAGPWYATTLRRPARRFPASLSPER